MKKSLDQSNDKIINNVKNEIKVIEVKKNYKKHKNKTKKNRSINIVRTKALSHRVGNLQNVQNKIENIKNIEEIGEKKNICCRGYNFPMLISLNSVLFPKVPVRTNCNTWEKLREIVKNGMQF